MVIDEKKLIEELHEWDMQELYLPVHFEDLVNAQPKADEWIPCEVAMPEEPFGCLVTIMDCEPMTQTDFENILPYHVGYDGKTWNDADGNSIPFEVIAWMPLPEPFKEGDA